MRIMGKNALVINSGSLNRALKVHKEASVVPQRKPNSTKAFARVLENVAAQQRDTGVKLSAHAQERLRQQNITISPQDIHRISEATEKAHIKGSKESLILLRDLALVVSVKNKTIITAVDRTRQKERIFTNIDSTVIL